MSPVYKEDKLPNVQTVKDSRASRRASPDLILACKGYFAAIGRPDARDGMGRAIQRFRELIDGGAAPSLIGRCTAYLLTKPFYADHPPTPEQVRDSFPLWERLGRPSRYQQTNGKPKTALDAIADELRAIEAQGVPDDDADRFPITRPADLPARPRQAPRQLPQHASG